MARLGSQLARRSARRGTAAPMRRPPDRNAQLLGFIGEIVLDSRAREMHYADRQLVKHRVVALEWSGLGMLRPVGLEGDLRDLAIVGPLGGDQLGTLGVSAVQQHHVGMLGVHLVSFAQISR